MVDFIKCCIAGHRWSLLKAFSILYLGEVQGRMSCSWGQIDKDEFKAEIICKRCGKTQKIEAFNQTIKQT